MLTTRTLRRHPKQHFGKAAGDGALVIGKCVLAEICPALAVEELSEFMRDWNIQFAESDHSSSILAGAMFSRYLSLRPATRGLVVRDFLIGAHAQSAR